MTWKKVMPFAVTVALSRVMTSWLGTSSTVSIMFMRVPMRSTKGTIMLRPGFSVLV